jgi:hypothetical protein
MLAYTLILLGQQKIKGWLGRRGKVAGMKGNPWAEWLTRFRTPTSPAPKKLADYQHYMQHDNYKSIVTDAYNARNAGVKPADRLALRAQVARECLSAESQDVRTRMKEEAEADHAALLAKHEDALEGLPALDEEDLEE